MNFSFPFLTYAIKKLRIKDFILRLENNFIFIVETDKFLCDGTKKINSKITKVTEIDVNLNHRDIKIFFYFVEIVKYFKNHQKLLLLFIPF